MDHRTYGETHNCKGCRYWSEMLAMSEGSGVKAMCLSSDSPQKSKYTYGSQTCDAWADGYLGAVDEPGFSEKSYFGDGNRESGGDEEKT